MKSHLGPFWLVVSDMSLYAVVGEIVGGQLCLNPAFAGSSRYSCTSAGCGGCSAFGSQEPKMLIET